MNGENGSKGTIKKLVLQKVDVKNLGVRTGLKTGNSGDKAMSGNPVNSSYSNPGSVRDSSPPAVQA